jgi:DNA-binding beta-propeller fold protein YncE
VWSKDGKHVAYAAFARKKEGAGTSQTTASKENEKEGFVVRDAERSAAYTSVKAISFSPDGRHLVFVATKGESQCVVIDGKERPTFDLIPNGGEPQWLVASTYRYLGLRGKSLYLVDDKVEP